MRNKYDKALKRLKDNPNIVMCKANIILFDNLVNQILPLKSTINVQKAVKCFFQFFARQ